MSDKKEKQSTHCNFSCVEDRCIAKQIAELKVENEQLIEQVTDLNNTIGFMKRDYDPAINQRDALRTALEEYGRHKPMCEKMVYGLACKCTCGFDAAKGCR